MTWFGKIRAAFAEIKARRAALHEVFRHLEHIDRLVQEYDGEQNHTNTTLTTTTMPPFRVGTEYRITADFGAMRDTFTGAMLLVYVYSAYSRYDGITGYFFHDIETGNVLVWDVHDMDDPQETSAFAHKHFAPTGAWEIPDRFHVEAPPLNAPAQGISSDALAPLLPAMQALVEGKADAENWFFWFERNQEVFHLVLKRAEFLRYKFAPFTESCRILDALGIAYTASPRYAWLDRRSV